MARPAQEVLTAEGNVAILVRPCGHLDGTTCQGCGWQAKLASCDPDGRPDSLEVHGMQVLEFNGLGGTLLVRLCYVCSGRLATALQVDR